MNGRHRGWQRPVFRRVTQGVILLALWVLVSAHTEREFVVLGFLSTVLAVGIADRLLSHEHAGRFPPLPNSVAWWLASMARFVWYVPWLLWQILLSNIHLVYLILHPRMPINPRLIAFDASLSNEPSQVIYAQSITLTSGTVTVDVVGGKYTVHSISDVTLASLVEGQMERKVGAIFGERVAGPGKAVILHGPEEEAR
ncbi:MAG: hypothetical protein FJ318_09970 [SAR202 cluster bacterium]|nr:hypothetical protein [SAR202 cluster bacterium]